jgi:hypothetical protein
MFLQRKQQKNRSHFKSRVGAWTELEFSAKAANLNHTTNDTNMGSGTKIQFMKQKYESYYDKRWPVFMKCAWEGCDGEGTGGSHVAVEGYEVEGEGYLVPACGTCNRKKTKDWNAYGWLNCNNRLRKKSLLLGIKLTSEMVTITYKTRD